MSLLINSPDPGEFITIAISIIDIAKDLAKSQRALACAGRDAANAGSPGWLELQRLASHAPARFRAAREEK